MQRYAVPDLMQVVALAKGQFTAIPIEARNESLKHFIETRVVPLGHNVLNGNVDEDLFTISFSVWCSRCLRP